MTQVELLVAFAEQVGIDIHDIQAAVAVLENNQGNLATLTTTQKASLVAAINEIKTTADGALTSATATTLINNALNGIIDGAPAAWDTFKEFADYVAADQTAAAAMLDALAKRVRVDAAQSFTVAEMDQGCQNLGIGTISTFDPKGAYEAKRDAA